MKTVSVCVKPQWQLTLVMLFNCGIARFIDCTRFGGTYTKIGTIQRRLAWPLRKGTCAIFSAPANKTTPSPSSRIAAAASSGYLDAHEYADLHLFRDDPCRRWSLAAHDLKISSVRSVAVVTYGVVRSFVFLRQLQSLVY